MSKHTPGPWTLMPASRETEWIVNQGGGVGYVCTAPRFAHRIEQCDANARLIAAAPELLEALIGIMSALEQLPVVEVSLKAWRADALIEAGNRARAAIAKAEGA